MPPVRILLALVFVAASSPVARAQFGPANVSLAPVVERHNVVAGHVFVGTVHPARRSVIGAAVAGRIVEFPVNAGDPVRAKQPLAQLLTRQIDLQIVAAEGDLKLKRAELDELRNGARPEELREAKAKTAAARALHDYMQTKLQRTKALFERNAVSEDQLQDDISRSLAAAQTFEAVQAAEDLLKAGTRFEKIAQAEARVAMAEAEVDRLKDLLVKHTIVSPFDGFVVAEHTEVGQWIESGGMVAAVEDLAEVELEAQVLENYLDHVRLRTQARIELPALPSEKLTAEVTAVVPRADERSRNFPVKLRMKNKFNPDGTPLIRSGMFARIWLPVERRESVLLVPKDAVVLGGPAPIVYVVDRSAPGALTGKARVVPVQLGTAFDGYLEASGPLTAGMEVVTEGNERLLPGADVRIVPGSRPPPAPPATNPAPNGPQPAGPSATSPAAAGLPAAGTPTAGTPAIDPGAPRP
jgi:RND family efflux transporter MFP subunit